MLQAILLLLLTLSDPRSAQASVGIEWTRQLVIDTLIERSEYWGANTNRLLSVARCETGGTYSPYLTGAAGEKGVGQWLPGRGNHWDITPAWKVWRIDVVPEYRRGNPDIVWLDIDMLAWSFGIEAPSGNSKGWSCA